MDYIDASNFMVEDAESDIDEIEEVMVRKTRGKDIDWEEIEVFSNPVEFKQSNFKKEIDEFMSWKNIWNTELARNENYVCKFKEKRGYKSCQKQYKLCFLSTSMHIAIFCNGQEHLHEEDTEFSTKINYHWTNSQTKIVEQGLIARVPNKVILKNLKDAGEMSNGKYPTLAQVGTKKRNMKKLCRKYDIVNIEEMKDFCKKKSAMKVTLTSTILMIQIMII